MHNLMKGAALAALLACAATTGTAASGLDHALENSQTTLQDVTSDVAIWVKAVDTKLGASSVAAGNTLSAELKGNSYVGNTQILGAAADVEANLSVESDWVGGKVDLTTQAIGNTASISAADAAFVNVHNAQTTGWQAPRPTDPAATTYVNIGQAEKVNSATQAVSNAFTLQTNAASLNLNSAQHNNSLTTAVANIDIGYTEKLTASSIAIGNQLSIAPINTP